MGDWILRFVKGIFIGAGFILPGLSGGALAAVFGIYERLISFVAHITKDFVKNLIFFIPVGIGGIAGVVLLSFAVSYAFGEYEVQILWFFIGCILGTLPSLWRQAGREGRRIEHLGLMVAAAVAGYIFLRFSESAVGGQTPLNTWTWLMAGAIIGLGVLVPGLSPSNFLVFMGMYKPMVDAFKTLDITVAIPVGIGGLACVLLFSKLMDFLFNKAYAVVFHFIMGIVIASTMIIVPLDFNYLSLGSAGCAVTCAAGVLLAWWMSGLEERYKPSKA